MIDYTVPDRTRAALLVIDAQRDYVNSDSPVRSAECTQTLAPLERLVHGARAADVPIFHMVRFYRPDGSNVDLCRRQSVEEGMRVLMPGSMGAELLTEIAPEPAARLDPHSLMDGHIQSLGPNEEVLYKPRWGGFYGTPLAERLAARSITTLIVCGFNFGTSGRATVLEASERDFRLVLVPEAAAGAADEAQRELCRIGVHLMAAERCLEWLAGQRTNLHSEQAA